jgi:hypothetical protein
MMFLYGYTAEKLNKEFQEVIKVEQLHNKHLNEKGTTRQPTLERDKAFDSLCKWYSKFRAVARIALYKKPELLEKIKIDGNRQQAASNRQASHEEGGRQQEINNRE